MDNDYYRIENKSAKKKFRDERIKRAIDNGVKPCLMNSKLSPTEHETHIILSSSGKAIVDSTDKKFFNKMIDKGCRITSVSYYLGQVVGMCFETDAISISIKTNKITLYSENKPSKGV